MSTSRSSRLLPFLLAAALPLAAVAADAMPPAGGTGTSTGSSTSGMTTGRDEPAPMFDQLDGNHDGFVTREEARRSADVTARFKEFDADKDGRVSLSEYKKGMQPKQ